MRGNYKKIQWKQNVAGISPRCGSLGKSLSPRLPLLSLKPEVIVWARVRRLQRLLEPSGDFLPDIIKGLNGNWERASALCDSRFFKCVFTPLNILHFVKNSSVLARSTASNSFTSTHLQRKLADTVCGMNEGQLVCPMTPHEYSSWSPFRMRYSCLPAPCFLHLSVTYRCPSYGSSGIHNHKERGHCWVFTPHQAPSWAL